MLHTNGRELAAVAEKVRRIAAFSPAVRTRWGVAQARFEKTVRGPNSSSDYALHISAGLSRAIDVSAGGRLDQRRNRGSSVDVVWKPPHVFASIF